MDDSLSGRVAAPRNKGVLVSQPLCIAARSRVKDTRADKPFQPRRIEATVRGSRCDHDHSGGNLSSVRQCEDPVHAPRAKAQHLPRKDVLGSKEPGLLIRPLGEFRAADTGGEAEKVSNKRTRARLSSNRLSLHNQRAQALG